MAQQQKCAVIEFHPDEPERRVEDQKTNSDDSGYISSGIESSDNDHEIYSSD